MKKTAERVEVYLEQLNGNMEVNDETLVAEFRNVDWAAGFLTELVAEVKASDGHIRYRVELACGKAYITKDGDNQFVRNI